MLLAYCAGLIAICTGLLVIATGFTIQNYWMLRRLSEGPPGKHDFVPAESEPNGTAHVVPVRTAPARKEPAARKPGRAVQYYESVETFPDDGEWTGPVVPYTPQNR